MSQDFLLTAVVKRGHSYTHFPKNGEKRTRDLCLLHVTCNWFHMRVRVVDCLGNQVDYMDYATNPARLLEHFLSKSRADQKSTLYPIFTFAHGSGLFERVTLTSVTAPHLACYRWQAFYKVDDPTLIDPFTNRSKIPNYATFESILPQAAEIDLPAKDFPVTVAPVGMQPTLYPSGNIEIYCPGNMTGLYYNNTDEYNRFDIGKVSGRLIWSLNYANRERSKDLSFCNSENVFMTYFTKLTDEKQTEIYYSLTGQKDSTGQPDRTLAKWYGVDFTLSLEDFKKKYSQPARVMISAGKKTLVHTQDDSKIKQREEMETFQNKFHLETIRLRKYTGQEMRKKRLQNAAKLRSIFKRQAMAKADQVNEVDTSSNGPSVLELRAQESAKKAQTRSGKSAAYEGGGISCSSKTLGGLPPSQWNKEEEEPDKAAKGGALGTTAGAGASDDEEYVPEKLEVARSERDVGEVAGVTTRSRAKLEKRSAS